MKLIIPNEIRYGLNTRNDTYTKKLGFMIYANKPDGTYGQQVSFDNWIEKNMPVKDIPNEYQTGFVLNKGRLNKYHFGASAKFRVFHPEGFEFEISLENLSLLIDHCPVLYGEIQVPCVIAWEGSNVYLLPKVDLNKEITIEYFDVLENKKKAKIRLEKRNNSGKPLSARMINNDKIVEDIQGNRYLVSAPKKTSRSLDSFTPSIVRKKGGDFVLNNHFGRNFYPEIVEGFPKLFIPLNKIDLVIEQNLENKLFKFIAVDDLTELEKSNLEKIKKQNVFLFNKEQEFVALNNDENSIRSFIEKVRDEKNKKKEGVLLNEVVKINDELCHIILGRYNRIDFGLPIHHSIKQKIEKLQSNVRNKCKTNECYDAYGYYLLNFIPVTTASSEEYLSLNKNGKQNIYYVDLFNIFNKRIKEELENDWSEFEKEELKMFMKILKPIEQHEVDEQKRTFFKEIC